MTKKKPVEEWKRQPKTDEELEESAIAKAIAHRARTTAAMRKARAMVNEIGELPPIVNPGRRGMCERDFHKFLVTYFPQSCGLAPYPHARLKELRAADVVDEPASNPDGMFSTTPIVHDADAALSYMLGLSTDKPVDQLFGVSIDRAHEFFTRFLSTKGLSIVSATTTTADPVAETDPATNPPATPPEVKPDESTTTSPTTEVVDEQLSSRAAFNAELSKFTGKFGAESGTKWFTEGKSFEEALSLHCDALNAANVELSAKLQDTQERLSQVTIGVKEPLATAGLSSEAEKKTIGSMTAPTK